MKNKHIGLVGDAGVGKDTVSDLIKVISNRKEIPDHVFQYAFAEPLKEFCSEVFDIPIRYFNDPVLKNDTMVKCYVPSNKHTPQDEIFFHEYMDRAHSYIKKWIVDDERFQDYLLKYANTPPRIDGVCERVIDRISGMLRYDRTTPRKIMQLVGTDCFRYLFGDTFWANIKGKQPDGQLVVFSDVRFESEVDYVQSVDKNMIVLLQSTDDHVNKAAGHSSEGLADRITDIVDNVYILTNDKSKGIDHLEKEVLKMLKFFYGDSNE